MVNCLGVSPKFNHFKVDEKSYKTLDNLGRQDSKIYKGLILDSVYIGLLYSVLSHSIYYGLKSRFIEAELSFKY